METPNHILFVSRPSTANAKIMAPTPFSLFVWWLKCLFTGEDMPYPPYT